DYVVGIAVDVHADRAVWKCRWRGDGHGLVAAGGRRGNGWSPRCLVAVRVHGGQAVRVRSNRNRAARTYHGVCWRSGRSHYVRDVRSVLQAGIPVQLIGERVLGVSHYAIVGPEIGAGNAEDLDAIVLRARVANLKKRLVAIRARRVGDENVRVACHIRDVKCRGRIPAKRVGVTKIVDVEARSGAWIVHANSRAVAALREHFGERPVPKPAAHVTVLAAIDQQASIDGSQVRVADGGERCVSLFARAAVGGEQRRRRRSEVVGARLPDAACPEPPETRLGDVNVGVAVGVDKVHIVIAEVGRTIAVRGFVFVETGLVALVAGDFEVGEKIVGGTLPIYIKHRVGVARDERQGGFKVTRPRGLLAAGPAAHRDVTSKLHGSVQPEFALKIN